MMERRNFQSAVDTLRRGNPASGYCLLRQVLLDDPNCAPAWLWMSGLVDDIEEQRECLEQTLILDPGCTLAHDGLKLLRLRETLARTPLVPPAPFEVAPRRLGEYLITQGFITEAQLEEALAEQRWRLGATGDHPLLGDIFIRRGWLTPRLLATTLILQREEERGAAAIPLPRRLGEYLVVDGRITPEQLAAVLEQQTRIHTAGTSLLLGELLQRSGFVTPAVLERALEQQRQDHFNDVEQEEIA